MSATLVHQNPSLMSPLGLGRDSRGVSVITPVMAVSVCRPAIVEGTPSMSRSGSAAHQSRHSSARSLPSRHHFRLLQSQGQRVEGVLPATISLSSSFHQPHPPPSAPEKTPGGELRETESVSLPKICSPIQLCSHSNSQTSIPAETDSPSTVMNTSRERRIKTPEKPSTFPNFRALQRLAASAKLRLHSLKSKEAKEITAALIQEKETDTSNLGDKNHSNDLSVIQRLSNGDAVDKENILDSSWSSPDEDAVQPSATSVEKSGAAGQLRSKSKKSLRSRSRRRAAKSANRKKRKPSASPAASTAKDGMEGLGNFTLASTMTLSSRWESKKVETFSTKYKTGRRRSNTKPTSLHAGRTVKATLSEMSSTSVALEKRVPASSQWTSATEQDGPLLETDKGMPMPRLVLEQTATVYGSGTQVSVRLSRTKADTEQHGIKKVFLSEKQSNALKECGKLVPCAPPASPTPEQLMKYEYVPSLTDLRSQRALKDRLTSMDAEEKKRRQKQREDRAKQERQAMRSNVCAMRQRQRQEIYALNKVMNDLEYSQFLKFCESQDKNN